MQEKEELTQIYNPISRFFIGLEKSSIDKIE